MSTKYTGPPEPETTPPRQPDAQPPAYLMEPVEPGAAGAKRGARRSIAAFAALGLSVLGFFLAWRPSMVVAALFLLTAGFTVGIVALFLRGRKWPAISAIVVSVVGVVVAVVVFVVSVGVSIVDSWDSQAAPTADGPATSDPLQEDTGRESGDTRDRPLPLGATARSDEWAVTLNGVDLDATAKVATANPASAQPGPGEASVLANLTVAYSGNDPAGAVPHPLVAYVFPDGTYFRALGGATATPEPLALDAPVRPGESRTGNLAVLLPSAPGADGEMAIQPDASTPAKFFMVR